jgi:hypothetical protein
MARFLRFFGLRSPIWPAVFSAFIGPGVGQFLNGDLKKGILLCVTTLGSFVWFSNVVGERLMLILPGTPEQWKGNPELLREAITRLFTETPGMFITFQSTRKMVAPLLSVLIM